VGDYEEQPGHVAEATSAPVKERSSEILLWIQYLYFLRFSLFYLMAIPILATVDGFGSISSITRGIFTPAKPRDFLGDAFFIVCVGVISLITTRLVCTNGKERFDVPPPRLLARALGPESDAWAGRILLLFQLPGLYVLFYIHFIAHRESIKDVYTWAVAASLGGIASAFIFWGSLNVIYYWTADDETGRPARTILLPRRWFGLSPIGGAKPLSVSKSPRFLAFVWKSIAGLGPGYSEDRKNLFGGHRFASIAAFGYLAVYIFLFPLTSPLPDGHRYLAALIAFGVVSLLAAVTISRYKPPTLAWAKYLFVFSWSGLAATAWYLAFNRALPSSTFPVLSSVLVLLTLLALIVCGIAFLVDRYHVPVLLSFFALLWCVHALTSLSYNLLGVENAPRFGGNGEHFFHVTDLGHAPSLASPEEIMRLRNCGDPGSTVPCPLIIVSAAGGGIHAAAWTTLVLTKLEDAFNAQGMKGYRFHQGVVFFSSVSGGSVGLVPFLNEYYAKDPFPIGQAKEMDDRMFDASSRSTLEAVTWGLEYRDFDMLLAPYLSRFFKNEWDRSAALEAGFRRNVFGVPCEEPASSKPCSNLKEPTLGGMADDLKRSVEDAKNQDFNHVPAFAMNTTAAETGGRFLLANYRITLKTEEGVPPAESFLTAYGAKESGLSNADIPLSTAARLSATFPYVSSAARSDREGDVGTFHYVDGGYYDNDGIASVVEFLVDARDSVKTNQAGSPLKVPILLIEIRDGPDLNADISPESYVQQKQISNPPCNPTPCKQPKPHGWGTADQFKAPLGAFWDSGHEAVTRRNRRELEVLLDSMSTEGGVSFLHIVLDYREPQSPPPPDKSRGDARARPLLKVGSSQPLSWYLTPSQKNLITRSADRLQPCFDRAEAWAESSLHQSPQAPLGTNSGVDHCNQSPTP
jgi:hypothetical protein